MLQTYLWISVFCSCCQDNPGVYRLQQICLSLFWHRPNPLDSGDARGLLHTLRWNFHPNMRRADHQVSLFYKVPQQDALLGLHLHKVDHRFWMDSPQRTQLWNTSKPMFWNHLPSSWCLFLSDTKQLSAVCLCSLPLRGGACRGLRCTRRGVPVAAMQGEGAAARLPLRSVLSCTVKCLAVFSEYLHLYF